MEEEKRTLLIVDDVELNRAILNEIFCRNYHIIEAVNGKEALDIILKNRRYAVSIPALKDGQRRSTVCYKNMRSSEINGQRSFDFLWSHLFMDQIFR